MPRTVRVRRHRRKGRRVRSYRRHLYSNKKDRAIERREFTERYGPEKGRYVYGATVGKVRREKRASRRRRHGGT